MFVGLQRFPHWYTIVRVCVYCAQFFDQSFFNTEMRVRVITNANNEDSLPLNFLTVHRAKYPLIPKKSQKNESYFDSSDTTPRATRT